MLDAVADLRVENQLTCGIDGYPAKGCSVTVKNPPAAPTEETVDFTLPGPARRRPRTGSTQAADRRTTAASRGRWSVVVVVVLVLAGRRLALSRRDRNA